MGHVLHRHWWLQNVFWAPCIGGVSWRRHSSVPDVGARRVAHMLASGHIFGFVWGRSLSVVRMSKMSALDCLTILRPLPVCEQC